MRRKEHYCCRTRDKAPVRRSRSEHADRGRLQQLIAILLLMTAPHWWAKSPRRGLGMEGFRGGLVSVRRPSSTHVAHELPNRVWKVVGARSGDSERYAFHTS